MTARHAAETVPEIGDYALIGNLRTCALVDRRGSMDWLCLPRFDSPACFAKLLGDRENGAWTIAPEQTPIAVRRRYVDGTLVLETEFETTTGAVRLTDFMPLARSDSIVDVVRIVTGLRGSVRMTFDLCLRCDYGSVVPWVRRRDDGIAALAGPDAFRVRAPFELEGRDMHTLGSFTVSEGEDVSMTMTWHPSCDEMPAPCDAKGELGKTIQWWRAWSAQCQAPEEWRDAVVRSAITLKALTDCRTGGIVAAPTTSLPEMLGGTRNWDYRYCWLRDATFTLYALVNSGYADEAAAWRQWLVRSVAGEPSKLQIMYGIAGERRLEEYELPWLRGFAGSRPVRVGNAAFTQNQLDVFGEVMDAFHCARQHGLEVGDDAWRIQLELIAEVERIWRLPGAGMWEQRGPPRRFVNSMVMAWVAADRMVKSVECHGLSGPVDDWRRLRGEIHDAVCREGFDAKQNTFVQYVGGTALDASALLMPLVGFLPPSDPRIVGTIDAIQQNLVSNGLVRRYLTDDSKDGLPPGEGMFVICSFWLADNLMLIGRTAEARALFERLLETRNDLGLLAEEYDPVGGNLLGNFPQALSHVGLINTAHNLSRSFGAAKERSRTGTS